MTEGDPTDKPKGDVTRLTREQRESERRERERRELEAAQDAINHRIQAERRRKEEQERRFKEMVSKMGTPSGSYIPRVLPEPTCTMETPPKAVEPEQPVPHEYDWHAQEVAKLRATIASNILAGVAAKTPLIVNTGGDGEGVNGWRMSPDATAVMEEAVKAADVLMRMAGVETGETDPNNESEIPF